MVLKKEHKGLVGQKQDADVFYSNFGGAVSEITGSDGVEVIAYLEMRRTDPDRFSLESQDKAIQVLTSLCKG
jgi:hypothetical protein